MIICGDIGGTNSRLAIFDEKINLDNPLFVKTLVSKDYKNFSDLIRSFFEIAGIKEKIKKGSFGVPGPVVGGAVETTNLPWSLNEDQLEIDLDIEEIYLVNDLVAIAHSISILKDTNLYNIYIPNEDNSKSNGIYGVVAPGTGLGQAVVAQVGKDISWSISSEGGHVEFSPRNELEIEFLKYFLERKDRMSVERVLSGPGLLNCYRFLTDSKKFPLLNATFDRFKTEAPAKVITELALNESDPACQKALDIFISTLGSHIGNTVLNYISLGGIYIGGGIAPNILPLLRSDIFREAYLAKGRLSALVKKTPVWVILDKLAGLKGAGQIAINRTKNKKSC
jgi:glucokinase